MTANLDILCSNPLDLKTKITIRKHKKIFCGPPKNLEKISWPISIFLKYLMTPQNPSVAPHPPLTSVPKEGIENIGTHKGLSKTFNNHYVNIIEKKTWTKPGSDLQRCCDMNIHYAVSKIKNTYANHPRIIEINKVMKNESGFSFKEVVEEEILKLLKSIEMKKSTGEGKLPLSLLNMLVAIYTNL